MTLPRVSVPSPAEFAALTEYVLSTCGIVLDKGKRSLVVSRLQQVLLRERITTWTDYLDRLRSDLSGRMRSELVDRLSTNHTFFWRETAHFDALVRVALPPIVAARRDRRKLRVWCAASSSGQEPYTLAALVADFIGAGYSGWDAGVLATDISAPVLERARIGIYEDADVRRLPDRIRQRWFVDRGDGTWQASEQLRRDVTFRRFNLMNATYPFKDPFDIVFCRNVMIYFDMPTKREVVGRIVRSMHRGGHLFIGAAESLPPDAHGLEQVEPGVYRKP